MLFRKVIFSSLLAFGLSALAIASTPNTIAEDASTTSSKTYTEIKKIVKKIDFDMDKFQDQTVKVQFMINADNELVILRINNDDAEYLIKRTLNYKELKENDLKVNKVYILPISFQKGIVS